MKPFLGYVVGAMQMIAYDYYAERVDSSLLIVLLAICGVIVLLLIDKYGGE